MRGGMREEGRLERKEGLHSRGHLEAMLAHASWWYASKGENNLKGKKKNKLPDVSLTSGS